MWRGWPTGFCLLLQLLLLLQGSQLCPQHPTRYVHTVVGLSTHGCARDTLQPACATCRKPVPRQLPGIHRYTYNISALITAQNKHARRRAGTHLTHLHMYCCMYVQQLRHDIIPSCATSSTQNHKINGAVHHSYLKQQQQGQPHQTRQG